MSNLKAYVEHCKRKLERNLHDKDMSLSVIVKLSTLPVTKELLESTGVWKALRQLSEEKGELGERAAQLCRRWRRLCGHEPEKRPHPQPAHDAPRKIPDPGHPERRVPWPPPGHQAADGVDRLAPKNAVPAPEHGVRLDLAPDRLLVPDGKADRAPEDRQRDNDKMLPARKMDRPSGNTLLPCGGPSMDAHRVPSQILVVPKPLKDPHLTTKSLHNPTLRVHPPEVSPEAPLGELRDPRPLAGSGASDPDLDPAADRLERPDPDAMGKGSFSPDGISESSDYNQASSLSILPSGEVADSPSKCRVPEPYAIAMREGMFRAVKTCERVPQNILKLQQIYDTERGRTKNGVASGCQEPSKARKGEPSAAQDTKAKAFPGVRDQRKLPTSPSTPEKHLGCSPPIARKTMRMADRATPTQKTPKKGDAPLSRVP